MKNPKTKNHKAENPIYTGRAETGRAKTGRESDKCFGLNLNIKGKAIHWQRENKAQGKLNHGLYTSIV